MPNRSTDSSEVVAHPPDHLGGAVAPSASERALEYLREAIIDGTFPPESMLSEAEVADRLGMSRTPVRVALARLQDEGWVRIYPKRGAMVRGLSADELTDLAHARFVLESSGVTLATPAQRVALAGQLDDNLTAQEAAFDDGDVDRFIELTLAFHRAFLEVGGNRYLIELGDRLSERQRWKLFANRARLVERRRAILAEHRELSDRLRADDPEGFAAVLREHITETAGRDVGSP